MKGRESGMPDEDCWSSFFDTEGAVGKLFGKHGMQCSLVEFGDDTFTVPAARRTTEIVSALDIESDMVKYLVSG